MKRRTTPPATCSPVEAASVLDRVYFDHHPDESAYLREYVPGEFGPTFPTIEVRDLPGTIMVEVEQLAPGMRRRRPAFVALESVVCDD